MNNHCTPVSWRINRPAVRRSSLFPFGASGDMGRLLDEFLGFGQSSAVNGGSTPGFVPALTIHEEKERYVVTAEVPGVPEKDIEISLADGILTVSGEKKVEETGKTEGKTHYVSRRFGSFSRQIQLDSNIDESKIDAVVKDGVLTITLPKTAAEEKVKKVTVRSER